MSARVAVSAVAVSASIWTSPSASRGAGEVAVLGPEIVAPLRDAMRLVDGEAAHAGLREASR